MSKKTIILSASLIVIVGIIAASIYFLSRNDSEGNEDNNASVYTDDLPTVEEIFRKFEARDISGFSNEVQPGDLEAYSFEKVLYNKDNLKVIKRSQSEDGDEMAAGGCMIDTSKFLLSIDNKYYEISLNNIIYLSSPEDLEEYLSVVKFYNNFNYSFCGLTTYYSLNDYSYQLPESFQDVCELEEEYSIKSTIEKKNDEVKLTFFEENIQQPLSLNEYQLVVADGNAEIKFIKTVYECEHGLIF